MFNLQTVFQKKNAIIKVEEVVEKKKIEAMKLTKI